MGLIHPRDLDAWRRWQRSQKRLRSVVAFVRQARNPELPARGTLHVVGEPRTLVVMDALGASNRQSLLAVARHLADVAVLAPGDLSEDLPGATTRDVAAADVVGELPELRLVLALGHYLPLSGAVHTAAHERGLQFCVSQHGLLTPFAPPLPPDVHAFAWSHADAEFWGTGRGDVALHVVGSQLLYESGRLATRHVSRFERPTFLGQLHGAELPRAGTTRAAFEFCRLAHATYRPHPAEQDVVSRATHRMFERVGIPVDRSGIPLNRLSTPVVAAFSTGVLEAAAQGVPGWVYYPQPPTWLQEFWDRYGLALWGQDPTPRPPIPHTEPASLIADWITNEVEGLR